MRNMSILMLLLNVVMFLFVTVAYTNPLAEASLTAAYCAVISFGTLMPSRTKKGAEAARQIDGLVMYMNAAERSRKKAEFTSVSRIQIHIRSLAL